MLESAAHPAWEEPMKSPAFTSSSLAPCGRLAPHLWIAALLAGVFLMPPRAAFAHDIPSDVTVQAFVKPAGEHLELLIREIGRAHV